MAEPTAAEAMRDAEVRLQDQQEVLSKTEFYYRAHVKSVIDAYNSENVEVPSNLREQAKRATQKIEDAKKMLASRRDDMRTARVRLYAEQALHKERSPKSEERDVHAGPTGNKRKRDPTDDLLPQIVKRLQTGQGHSNRVEPGQIATLLSLLEDGTLTLGDKFPDDGNDYSGGIEVQFDECFGFYREEYDDAELTHFVNIFEYARVLLISLAVPTPLRPRQMDRFVDVDACHADYDMTLLAQCAYKIRIDSRVIGCVAMSMAKGTVSPADVDDLVASIRKTHAPWQQKQFYGIPPLVGGAVPYILGKLASSDPVNVRSMVYDILHSATVLAKYSCLATSITVAIATFFDPRGELAKDAVNAAAITETLNHHRALLASLRELKESVPVSQELVQKEKNWYNSDNHIEEFLKSMQLEQRLSPIVPQVTDLVSFLTSQGLD